jgi:hypothetical protein
MISVLEIQENQCQGIDAYPGRVPLSATADPIRADPDTGSPRNLKSIGGESRQALIDSFLPAAAVH